MDYNRLWASIQESYKVWPVSFTPQIKLVIRAMKTPLTNPGELAAVQHDLHQPQFERVSTASSDPDLDAASFFSTNAKLETNTTKLSMISTFQHFNSLQCKLHFSVFVSSGRRRHSDASHEPAQSGARLRPL